MKKKYLILIITVAVLAVVFIMYKWKNFRESAAISNETQPTEDVEEVPPLPAITYLYGIPSDSFDVVTGKVGRNQPLSCFWPVTGSATSKSMISI